jgi:hypothetical protein
MSDSDNNEIIFDDELYVATKFVRYLNRTHNKDFVLPYHPDEDRGIDAVSYSESNPIEVLRMQIVSSDFKAREELGKRQMYEVSRDLPQMLQDAVDKPISYKSGRYPPDLKKEVILLLDGWWSVLKEDLDHFKTNCLDSYFRLKDAGFKEVWFVSMKDGGPICQLYPC